MCAEVCFNFEAGSTGLQKRRSLAEQRKGVEVPLPSYPLVGVLQVGV